jgi:integrase/recombinase XerD
MPTELLSPMMDPSRLGSRAYVNTFVDTLRAAGYPQRTLNKKRVVVTRFLEWLMRQGIPVTDANEATLAGFLLRLHPNERERLHVERAAVRGFLRHLAVVANSSLSASESCRKAPVALLDRYTAYLRTSRGLTARSVQVYLPLVRLFVDDWDTTIGATSPADLSAQIVRAILLDRIRGRGYESARLHAVAVRSLLRFFFLEGKTALDLSLAVPTVRRCGLARVHAFFLPAEVERIVAAPDRSTSGGRRDHAMLLLLARLGLRAGEVVGLELGDIRWRAGEIMLRGKGRSIDRMPLPADVGEALALYIEKDRGANVSRRVFLRKEAPRAPLSGPGAVGHVVRAALAQVGLRSARRGAAHLLRHSLATQMIGQGASLTEIGQILRHRSLATTEIYAKVDFPTLRGVARSWPEMGREE